MRDPLAQPLTIDGALVTVRNAPLLVSALGLRGLIVMWSGAIRDIPAGWGLCDGTQGTPDLRDRFIVGAVKDAVGKASCTLTGPPTQFGGDVQHTHTFTTNGHTHLSKSGGPFSNMISGLDVTSARDTGTTDGPNTVAVPYFALAFIMKL